MKRETTLHPYVALLCLTLIGLMLPHTLQAEGRIRLKTDKAINQSIGIKIKANGSVRVSGATGKFKNGSTVYYKLSAQEVTFEGEILQFENLMGEITALHLENTTSLQELNVNFNKIEQIDLSACPQLTYINVMSNQLTRLDLSSNPLLTSINLAQNKVSELNIEACTAVASLDCGNNALSSLNLSNNTQLGALNCSFNKLSTLDLSALTALKHLNCAKNELTQLDISHNRELEILSCFLNPLEEMDFTHNGTLVIVDCGLSSIRQLDLSPLKALSILDVSGCQLTSLDVSHNKELTRLNCHQNKLTALSVANNPKIKKISCYENEIKGEKMTQLMRSLRSLDGQPIDPRQGEGEVLVINTQSPNEKNICTKSQVALALGKDWLTKDLNGKYQNRIDYSGSEDEVMTDYIAFSHGKAVGSKIKMKINANEAVAIEGATGTWVNGQEITYTVDLPRILIQGKVISLECSDAEMTNIDLSSCPTLRYLDVSINKIPQLDLSKVVQLEQLKCEYNPLEQLDLSHNPKISKIWCYATLLRSIDVRQCPELELLSCNDCKLTQLDLTHNRKLSKLSCSGNALGTLDLSQNSELEVLWCAMTGLQTLDLTPFAKLRQVLCQANSLTSIDLSHNPALTLFWGSSNQFTSLDFSHNPQLLEAFFYDNRIDESHMEQLIASLPQRTASDQAGLIVIQPNSTTEQNICRVEQVDKAKAKHYKVYAALNSNATAKEEYPGSVDCELIGITAVRCYPNPASHFVQISQATPSSTIRLIDASGNLLLEERTSDMGDAQLDVRHLPVGSYLLIVDNAPHRLLIAH